MRIVDEWSEQDMKVTIFHFNEKFSIKVEKNLLEQIFKFRQGQFSHGNQIKTSLTEEFYNECQTSFAKMNANRASLFKIKEDDFEFPEII